MDIPRRKCAFILKVENPFTDLPAVLFLMKERKILLVNLNFHQFHSGEGRLIFHCLLERDRIRHFEHLLLKMEGIKDIERLECNARGQ